MIIISAGVIVLLLLVTLTAFWVSTLLGEIFNAQRENPFEKPVPEVKGQEKAPGEGHPESE